MESLNKTQRAKVFPAAKVEILDHYVTVKDVPKWSDIGTLVRISLREAMISQLRVSDNGDRVSGVSRQRDKFVSAHKSQVRFANDAIIKVSRDTGCLPTLGSTFS